MTEALQVWLDQLAAAAQADLEARNQARDEALQKSRELIRLCSSAIRSGHREMWDEANALLTEAEAVGREMQALLAPYPDLFYAGYTQDALKELVEARVTLALISNGALPSLDNLSVPYDTYLNGACEAASELRRRCLDTLLKGHSSEAARLLEEMDDIYAILVTMDYPDAITGGLRRLTDVARGIIERTRGDLTISLRQERLENSLRELETRLDNVVYRLGLAQSRAQARQMGDGQSHAKRGAYEIEHIAAGKHRHMVCNYPTILSLGRHLGVFHLPLDHAQNNKRHEEKVDFVREQSTSWPASSFHQM